jgi:hypothetical protein
MVSKNEVSELTLKCTFFGLISYLNSVTVCDACTGKS